MTTGTKSILFGAHAFWLHPWFVAWGWWKLYGFPWDPRLWVVFIVHDLGYWGLDKMDDEQGELHPILGARIVRRLFDGRRDSLCRTCLDGKSLSCFLSGGPNQMHCTWALFTLLHSRFFSKRFCRRPSRLCFADKLSIALTPSLIYVPMTLLTGEIRQYMGAREASGGKVSKGWEQKGSGPWDWHARVQDYCFRWVEEHKDGREDTWTPEKGR